MIDGRRSLIKRSEKHFQLSLAKADIEARGWRKKVGLHNKDSAPMLRMLPMPWPGYFDTESVRLNRQDMKVLRLD